MQTIVVETWIAAPPQCCFDAARNLDLHVVSVSHTNEQAVAGRTSGLIELGEEVTWRARHFGVYQHFTSKITAFQAPTYFQDSMQRGAFKSFIHDHFFSRVDGGTKMKDAITYSAPFGAIGWGVEKVILNRYLRQLLVCRAAAIKSAAERTA